MGQSCSNYFLDVQYLVYSCYLNFTINAVFFIKFEKLLICNLQNYKFFKSD